MNVYDIMTPKPSVIRLQNTLHDALEMMERIGCHHLPVLSTDNHLIGIISDRDCRTALNSPYIMREDWQDDELANRLQVRSIMTPAPIVVPPDVPAEDAARLMLVNHVSSLPVMRDETLVGIVTTSDILKAFINLTARNDYLNNAKNIR